MDETPNTNAAPAPDAAITAPDINGAPAGSPTAPTSNVGPPGQQTQPAAPPKESVGRGILRGLHGETYVVDGKGSVENSRTTAPSGKGEFGSILGGIVMGALAGAQKARPGRIPSAEIGGGFGAGMGAAIDAAQERDLRNRAQAQTTFGNQQQVQKMSREQAVAAAEINHLAAQTSQEVQATKFADEEHPLHVAGLKAGLEESSQRIQMNSQALMKGATEIWENLGEMGITPQAIVSNHNDARGHIPGIVQGQTLPIYNGKTGEDGGVGMFEVDTLKRTPTMKPVTFKTYPTTDKDGNAVEQINTLPAGSSALDYYKAAALGHGQLLAIQSQQKVKMAVESHKAEIKEKNAQAFKANEEGKLADAKAKSTATGLAGITEGAENLHGEDYLKTLPTTTAGTVRAFGEGRQILSQRMLGTPQGRAMLDQIHQAYPDFQETNAKTWDKTMNEYTGSGKTAATLIRANTAMEHARELYDVTTVEGVWNPLSTAYNDRTVTLGKLNDEVNAAIKGSVVGQAEGEKALHDLSGGLTIGAKRERIKKLTTLLHDRMEETQTKFNDAAPSKAVKVPTLMSQRAASAYDHVQSDGQTQQQQPQPNPQKNQAPAKIGDTKTFPNGRVGVWDGHGYVAQ